MRSSACIRTAAALAAALAATPVHAQTTAAPPTAATEAAVVVGHVVLRYAVAGPADGEPVLLIGGTATQLTDWPAALVDGLAARGFRVITFDHRDSGRSTHLDDAGAPDWPAIFGALAAGAEPPLAYTLDDMADDAVGLLDALSIDRAHLFGTSMGGMIAQIIAAKHPERTRSLTSAMAGSGNPAIRIPADPARLAAVPPPPPAADTAAAIERQVAMWRALASPENPVDEATLRARIAAAVARAYDPVGAERQGAAAAAAGDRRAQLRTIRAPTVVVHGADDPLVPVEAGREVASLIPGAELRVVPGMGHDLPDAAVPSIVDAIASAAARAAGQGPRD
ncbi:MAG TPA: alpha/beta hydrolase [Longimicrobiales bacterium]